MCYTGQNNLVSTNVLVWKFCRNCAFPQNFDTRKLGETKVFDTVLVFGLQPRRRFWKPVKHLL